MDTEPAVQMAVTAVGMAYEAHLDTDVAKTQNPKAQPQLMYAKAMTAVQRLVVGNDSDSTNTFLVCSLLFVCFNILQNDLTEALQSLNEALKVVQKKIQPPESAHPQQRSSIRILAAYSTLEDALVRLDTQASMYAGLRSPMLCCEQAEEMPSSFLTIAQARHHLDLATHNLQRFVRNTADDYRYRSLHPAPPAVVAERAQVSQRIASWEESSTRLKNHIAATGHSPDLLAFNTLTIQLVEAKILAVTCLEPEETVFDQFDELFHEVLELSKQLALHVQSTMTSSQDLKFFLDNGIIHPLYFTGTRCRVEKIRKGAITLLNELRFSEGVWNAHVLAAIARRAMAVEEERPQTMDSADRVCSSGRVPEKARVHGIDVATMPDDNVVHVIFTQRLNGPETEWCDREEWIDL